MDRLDAAIDAQASAFTSDVLTWRDDAGRTLSDRIWSNRLRLEARLDEIIRNGIRDGATLDEVADQLIPYVRPSYSPYGRGKARHAALRLAQNETRRALSLGERDTSLKDPLGGYLRFVLSASHIERDVCDSYANHEEGFGRGVYRAKDAPLPPVHVGCKDRVRRVEPAANDINAYVDRLRVSYGLDQEPTDLSPADLAIWRVETGKVRDAVEFLFRAWLDQTELVTPAQLIETSPSVRQWVADVAAEKARER